MSASPDPRLLDRAARVRLVLCDVDGVLTDGGLYYFDGGLAVRFDVKDGLGLARARQLGLLSGIISGRQVEVVAQRARELKLDEIHLGVADKAACVQDILRRRGLGAAQLAFIGDDLIDLPAMALAGFPVAVADALPEVRAAAVFVTTRPGGHGAVRETIDLLLAARPPGPAGEEPCAR